VITFWPGDVDRGCREAVGIRRASDICALLPLNR
jgi:hypothetical protein